MPAAGSVQLALLIPGDRTVANISPGIITSRKSENGHTAIEATLVPGQTANVWWATREVVAPVVPREIRFLSDAKALVSVSEAEMRVAVLADITVVQGEPRQFQVELPTGYEVTGVTGGDARFDRNAKSRLDVEGECAGTARASVSDFNGAIDHRDKADTPFLRFKGAQRETGEVLVEGAGTMEITANEGGGLKRMDVKEANPYLRSLAHFPRRRHFAITASQRNPYARIWTWVRFPDGSVLAAMAETAVVTTLVTSEGKSLTESEAHVEKSGTTVPESRAARGRGQFFRQTSPASRVKPVRGPDGSRVPLLRPGSVRPTRTPFRSYLCTRAHPSRKRRRRTQPS